MTHVCIFPLRTKLNLGRNYISAIKCMPQPQVQPLIVKQDGFIFKHPLCVKTSAQVSMAVTEERRGRPSLNWSVVLGDLAAGGSYKPPAELRGLRDAGLRVARLLDKRVRGEEVAQPGASPGGVQVGEEISGAGKTEPT